MSTTMSMPKKDAEQDVPAVETGQKRRTFERYQLQVDRQMKASYPTYEAAEKAATVIKKAHSIVQVSIYDAKDWKTTILN